MNVLNSKKYFVFKFPEEKKDIQILFLKKELFFKETQSKTSEFFSIKNGNFDFTK